MKTYTVLGWCQIFGIELIDNDGFRRLDVKIVPITLNQFVEGIVSCTINPVDPVKYSVLAQLW